MRNVQKPRRESRRVAIRRRTEDRRTNRGESILLEARVGVWYPERHASAVVGHVVPFLVVFSTIFRGVPLLTGFSFSFSSQRLYKRLKGIEHSCTSPEYSGQEGAFVKRRFMVLA